MMELEIGPSRSENEVLRALAVQLESMRPMAERGRHIMELLAHRPAQWRAGSKLDAALELPCERCTDIAYICLLQTSDGEAHRLLVLPQGKCRAANEAKR